MMVWERNQGEREAYAKEGEEMENEREESKRERAIGGVRSAG